MLTTLEVREIMRAYNRQEIYTNPRRSGGVGARTVKCYLPTGKTQADGLLKHLKLSAGAANVRISYNSHRDGLLVDCVLVKDQNGNN